MPTTSKKARNPDTPIHVVGSDGGEGARSTAYWLQNAAIHEAVYGEYRDMLFRRAAQWAEIADAQDALIPIAYQPAGMIPIRELLKQ